MSPIPSKSFGNLGEQIAVNILRSKGYAILDRNFRSKFGEIDIVAKDGETLVFVEVKARIGNKFGTPEEAVLPWKLEKIKRTAEYFCMTNEMQNLKMRIEVVALTLQNDRLLTSKIIVVD